MRWLRKMTLPVTALLFVVFMLGMAGCKTTKIYKEHEDNPPTANPDPDPGGPGGGRGPRPPT